ncbi:type II secretion system protein J [Massilia sp. BJB1822]|uniref:PulJ/GspJ family protein n=1 Tax=Massilia sp. BJB1822 TaxID=2744470 RepID=UPI001593A983|nr:prepilin-type N-terminal cleavage/methylation domain-containing protein [Massilia sp. BJB1822]NVD97512.1 prepilin-type N-terminal cleavage/methylation domain-containing protein [Massilia sp. BJB1822]
MKKHHKGFTLVELIVVMVIVAVLATSLVVFLRPALNNYLAVGRRAALSDQADGAMRLMMRDIRLAVPNSIRQPANNCFELVPGSGGGRFRIAADSTTANSLPLQASEPVPAFDIFMPQAPVLPAVGDWIVIGNLTAADIYNTPSPTRSKIQLIAAPPVSATPVGTHRITVASPPVNIPPGYDGARFMVVPVAIGPVMYACNPGLANGRGTGTLLRYSGYGFNANQNNCNAPLTPAGQAAAPFLVASNVSTCTMTYDPNPGATQGSGYISIQLTLTDDNESVALTYGAHTSNVP